MRQPTAVGADDGDGQLAIGAGSARAARADMEERQSNARRAAQFKELPPMELGSAGLVVVRHSLSEATRRPAFKRKMNVS